MDMIINRTQFDVLSAAIIRKEKVQKFQPLTESDIQTLEKGTITVNTLNRIESKQEELKNLLNEMGYYNTPIETKVWTKEQIFSASELQRILYNTNILKNAFFVYKNTPTIPFPKYRWQELNALEQILHDIDVMISEVRSFYRECGNIECGE